MFIRTNHTDMIKEAERLGKEEWELTSRLSKTRARKHLLQKLIRQNDEGEKAWIVEVPEKALVERKKDVKSVNWQHVVMEMFEKYKLPMTADLICHKLWFHCSEVGFEKRSVLQAVSAALSSLAGKEQKIYRMKCVKGKGYIYGLKDFFNINGKLKPSHYRNWLREEGKTEVEITERMHDYTKADAGRLVLTG